MRSFAAIALCALALVAVPGAAGSTAGAATAPASCPDYLSRLSDGSCDLAPMVCAVGFVLRDNRCVGHHPPVAAPGATQAVPYVTSSPPTVVLNGSLSTDVDTGSAGLSYAWTNVTGVGAATLSQPTSVSTAVNNLPAGRWVFQLTVTDPDGLSSSGTVTVWTPRVTAVAGPLTGTCYIGSECRVTFNVTGFDVVNGSASAYLALVPPSSSSSSSASLTYLVSNVAVQNGANVVVWSVPPSQAVVTGGAVLRVVVVGTFGGVASAVVVPSSDVTVALSVAAQWTVSEYSPCSVSCGSGVQSRNVTCFSAVTGTSVSDDQCTSLYPSVPLKPSTTTTCFAGPCATNGTVATYSFYAGEYSGCNVSCGSGVQSRSVSCVNATGGAVSMSLCSGVPPASVQACDAGRCDSFSWRLSEFGPCSTSCGGGVQSRSAACVSALTGSVVLPTQCVGSVAASLLTQACATSACALAYRWQVR